MSEIMVSVFCTAYNHEKYIRKCLDGFVMQQTDFKFEVLVHDDASTDHTADIIREYEEKYPEIIRSIYQKENQFSQHVPIISTYLFPKAKGKYVALCEGDDYWIDPLKLKKQVDALETHSDCHMCVCKIKRVSEDEKSLVGYYPSFPLEEGVILADDFIRKIIKQYSFQTSGYFFRTVDLKTYFLSPPAFRKVCPVGDEAYLLYFGYLGDVYYIADELSCARSESIGSLMKQIRASKEKIRHYYAGMAETYKEFDQYTNYRYHEDCEQRAFDKYSYAAESQKEFFALMQDKLFQKQSLRRKTRIFLGAFCPPLLKLCYRIANIR